jgi:tetratricopeptide (TPR) repeat protein
MAWPITTALFSVGLFGAALVLGPASTALGQKKEVDHKEEYRACLALGDTNPAKAYQNGLAWFKMGGGLPARHCLAVALAGLGNFAEAASRFETLARDLAVDWVDLRAAMLGHAGHAWLLAGRSVRAAQVQGAAISLRLTDPALYVDRAVSLMTLKQYPAALADLDKALALAPGFADAYLYRASAKRYVGDVAGAWVDVTDTLILAPGLPAGVLERGILLQLDGDLDAARSDWLSVIKTAPDSDEARAARARIDALN